MYRPVKKGCSPSPKRLGGAGVPPSPHPLPPSLVTIDRDAKALQTMLRGMDELFYDNDGDYERQQRLRQFEEQQMMLRGLCEAALQQDEGSSGAACNSRVEAGIVSTSRSLETLSAYGDTGGTVVRRSESSNDVPSLLRPPPPPLPLYCPAREKAAPAPHNEYSNNNNNNNNVRTRLRPPSVIATAATATSQRKPLGPLSSPSLLDSTALEEDRRLIEEFLSVAQVDSLHPYAAVGDDWRETSKQILLSVPKRSLQGLNGSRGVTSTATTTTTATTRYPFPRGGFNEENFDVREEEELLKCIMKKESEGLPKPLQGHSKGSVPSASDALNNMTTTMMKSKESLQDCERNLSTLSDSTVPPSFKDSKNRQPTLARHRENITPFSGKDNNEEMPSTYAYNSQELLQENKNIHRELETKDIAIRELTHKTESLARHLVKSLRERSRLQSRVERLEETLERTNSEMGSLKRAAEEQSEAMCGVSAWRAAAHTKEREVRICEEELCRLRGIIEQRVMRSGNALAQETSAMVIAQENSDVEGLIQEVAATHVLRREAEQHAERISEELKTAQSHIQLLDSRLAEAERALAAHRLQEMRGHLACGDQLPPITPSYSGLPSLPISLPEDATMWPLDARRNLALLTSYAEGLVAQHGESDRHAELRLLQVRQENDELRARCRAFEAGVKELEDKISALQRERTLWKTCERRCHQQLLGVQEDAALIANLLCTTSKSAEKLSKSLQVLNMDSWLITEVKMFVKDVLCHWETMGRFLRALQSMNVTDLQQHNQEHMKKIPLSEATKARRDFVLQAVEAAMTQKTLSTFGLPQEEARAQARPESPVVGATAAPRRQKRKGESQLVNAPMQTLSSYPSSHVSVTQSVMNVDNSDNADDSNNSKRWKNEERRLSLSLCRSPELESRSALSSLRHVSKNIKVPPTLTDKPEDEQSQKGNVMWRRIKPLQPPVSTPRENVMPSSSNDRETPLSSKHEDHMNIRDSRATVEFSRPSSRRQREETPLTTPPEKEELSCQDLSGIGDKRCNSSPLDSPLDLLQDEERIPLPALGGGIDQEVAVTHLDDNNNNNNKEVVPHKFHSSSGRVAPASTRSVEGAVEKEEDEKEEEVVAVMKSFVPEVAAGPFGGDALTMPAAPPDVTTTPLPVPTVVSAEVVSDSTGGARAQHSERREENVGGIPEEASKPLDTEVSGGAAATDSTSEGISSGARDKNVAKTTRERRASRNAEADDSNNEPRLHMLTSRARVPGGKEPWHVEDAVSSSPALKPRRGQEPPQAKQSNTNIDKERKEGHAAFATRNNTQSATLADVQEDNEEGAGPSPILTSQLNVSAHPKDIAPSLHELRRFTGMTSVALNSEQQEEAQSVAEHSNTETHVADVRGTANNNVTASVAEDSLPNGERGRGGIRRPSAVMDFPSLHHPSLAPRKRGSSSNNSAKE